MKIRNILLCGIMSLLSLGAVAQNVKGTVRDASTNETLIGASVYWLGTNIGVATTVEGDYDLYRVKGYDKLVATYVGYKNDTITVAEGVTNIDFKLESDTQIEAVVVEGNLGNYVKRDGVIKSESPTVMPPKLPTFELFAAKIGVTVGTLEHWCEKYPRFATIYAHAKEIQKGIIILNAMTKQYSALLGYDNVTLEFQPEALAAIADKAVEMEIGARGLRSVMERVMTDVMYSVPSDPTIEKVVITADCVTGDSEPEITHRAEQAG
jgi:hypothetical protein